MKSKILPITGDASFRTFYRIISNKNSKIIVFAKKEKYKNLIAYSSINKFLRDNKLLTPKLYSYNFLICTGHNAEFSYSQHHNHKLY